MRQQLAMATPWRPVAFVAVDDSTVRARIVDNLQRLGWTVTEHASGFHILRALADVIETGAADPWVDMIVVDEISRGCSGSTLARGLRDLGCVVPLVLVRGPWSSRPRCAYGVGVHVVDRSDAPAAIAELVRPWSPISIVQPHPPSRARATA
jgi:CheY-like chemotaxis protein